MSLTPMVESRTLPIADYFFISGLDSSQIFDALRAHATNGNGNGASSSPPMIGATINEDGPYTADSERPTSSRGNPEMQRRSKRFSYETRKSISSVINLENQAQAGHSNRSSATVRPSSSAEKESGRKQQDEDFDKALRNFAAERETFLEDINVSTQFSAGQVAQPNKPRPKAKTQRIVGEDVGKEDKGVGSIRRRISVMNRPSRQSTMKRLSARQSKRISGYNSVIPTPQRLKSTPDQHPLKRAYEPVLLDRYPPEKEAVELGDKRNPFPDFVPMFVFPNDIHVVSQEPTPRPTWHGFTMTGGDGAKLYGMCLIAWMPLPDSDAEELERHCERWRNEHISKEDREVLKVVGEKLARETEHLSRLLAQLPALPSDTHVRDRHEEEISRVEENIALMNQIIAPMRHGATSRIDGLNDTVGSGFWVPRAYGILGRDGDMTSFWKEWLRAVAIPITHGTLLHVPPSSPTVGVWQPLERYVVNMCTEAPQPNTSQVQVELSIRELRLYARREAINEIPGSRNTDLYPLFRCLNVPDIIILFEYVLSESRIILLSSHTAMLNLACTAIMQLLWPMKWAGAYVPVLPARMMEMLDAPFPYIFGIERRYLGTELPDDDFVLVDLDQGVIEATAPPVSLPRQQRRKLMSILQLAAPHHNRFGVPLGPPRYVADAYPSDTFASESPFVFESSPPRSNLSHLASLSSAAFGTPAATARATKIPMLNVFLQSQKDKRARSAERPGTASTWRTNSPPSPSASPTSSVFPRIPNGNSFRNESAHANALQNSLREKRSGRLDPASMRRNSSFGMSVRRPSLPFLGHQSTTSVSTLGSNSQYGGSSSAISTYAPSVYAQSSMAASTIMPQAMMQPVANTEGTSWQEGHCLVLKHSDPRTRCHNCDERPEEKIYVCSGCGLHVHPRCSGTLCLVCPVAFHADQIMAAFARCFASLFYTYRRFLSPANAAQKKTGLRYAFDWEQFMRSVPGENAEYIVMLRETQSFTQFIHEAQTLPPTDPNLHLFDAFISAKRSRGGATKRIFSRSARGANNPAASTFLSDTSDHLWATAAATSPVVRSQTPAPSSAGGSGDDHGHRTGRRYLPGKLDPTLLHKPRAVAGQAKGVRRGVAGGGGVVRRKMVPSVMINTEMIGDAGMMGPMSPEANVQSAPGQVECRGGGSSLDVGSANGSRSVFATREGSRVRE